MDINPTLEHRTSILSAILRVGLKNFEFNLPADLERVESSDTEDCTAFAVGDNVGPDGSLIRPYLVVQDEKRQPGDLVLYSYGDENVHIGVLEEDDMVVSKWGYEIGVLRHPIDSVPPNYGDRVTFLRLPQYLK